MSVKYICNVQGFQGWILLDSSYGMARPLKSTSKIYTAILKNIGSYIGKIIDHRIHEINRKDDRFKDEA